MRKTVKILTILGSPHARQSDTRVLVEDFVEELADAGLPFEHEVIPLGSKRVDPRRGCWSCTRDKACPQAENDLEEIKAATLEGDLLIMACPAHENQVPEGFDAEAAAPARGGGRRVESAHAHQQRVNATCGTHP